MKRKYLLKRRIQRKERISQILILNNPIGFYEIYMSRSGDILVLHSYQEIESNLNKVYLTDTCAYRNILCLCSMGS